MIWCLMKRGMVVAPADPEAERANEGAPMFCSEGAVTGVVGVSAESMQQIAKRTAKTHNFFFSPPKYSGKTILSSTASEAKKITSKFFVVFLCKSSPTEPMC